MDKYQEQPHLLDRHLGRNVIFYTVIFVCILENLLN